MLRSALRKRRKSMGFTMIEVMVAVGILAVSLLAVISILIYSFKSQAKGERVHTASLIAKTLLNEAGHLLGEDFDRLSLTPPLPGPGLVVYPDNQDYKVMVTLARESPNLKRVEVQVDWSDQNGAQSETTATKFLRTVQ